MSFPSLISGTSISVRFNRVIDGDTIRIYPPNSSDSESVRILSLDTEESFSFSSKPVTPWGKAAKRFTQNFFRDTSSVTVEFPGTEPVEEALVRYRDNYGRLLVWVYRDGIDFQQQMIARGYSPYFIKYGRAEFQGHDRRYRQAEREAQMFGRGVWDQIAVNGAVLRDYSRLGVWWELRAKAIDDYRMAVREGMQVLNTRKDYEKLKEISKTGERVTVFTEVNEVRRTAQVNAVADIGSDHQPFRLIIPDPTDDGEPTVNLLKTRYVSKSENEPRRGYCYVTGVLTLVEGRVQMVLQSTGAVRDDAPGKEVIEDVPVVPREREGKAEVRIVELVPSPDKGEKESVTLEAGDKGADLTGWKLTDKGGGSFVIGGVLGARDRKTFELDQGLRLNDGGDEMVLVDAVGRDVQKVVYERKDVKRGKKIRLE